MTPDTPDPPPLAELEAAVQRSPGDAAAWRALASGYGDAGMLELGVEMLGHAVRLTPRQARNRGALGLALIEIGRARDAIPHLQEAARLDPDDPARRTLAVGIGFAEAGDKATAARHFREALALDPALKAARVQLALALHDGGRYEEAVPALESATKARPASAEIWGRLAGAYARTGRHQEAIDAARLSLRFDPAQPEVLSGLFESCRALGKGQP